MIKVLCLLPGTIVSSNDNTTNSNELIKCNTLINSTQNFLHKEIINNLTSVENLQKQGFSTDVFCFSNRKKVSDLIKTGFKISSLTSTPQYQFVYVFWGGISGYITTIFSRKPVFLTLLGSDLLGTYDTNGKQNKKGKLLTFFTKKACKRARGIIVMSEDMRNKLPSKLHDKVLIAPECIDLSKFFPIDKTEARKKINIPQENKVVMFFPGEGRIVKNAVFANKIAQNLSAIYKHFTFLEIKNTPHSELVYYYNAADLLLITSLHEGSNNSIKEAIACNCPIVSSNAGDAKERLSNLEQCFVIDDFKEEKYIHAIETIFNNTNKPEIRKGVEDLTFAKTGKKIANFIKEHL